MKPTFTLNDTTVLLSRTAAAVDLLLDTEHDDIEQVLGVLVGIKGMIKMAESQVDSLPQEVMEEEHALSVFMDGCYWQRVQHPSTC